MSLTMWHRLIAISTGQAVRAAEGAAGAAVRGGGGAAMLEKFPVDMLPLSSRPSPPRARSAEAATQPPSRGAFPRQEDAAVRASQPRGGAGAGPVRAQPA